MQDFIISILSPNGVIYTIVVASIGAYCGHRFDLWRDRRNELNAVIDPIRERIISSQDWFLPKYGLSAAEVDRIHAMSGLWSWRRISSALKEYEKANPEYTEDVHGQTYMTNKEAVIEANKRLLAILKRG